MADRKITDFNVLTTLKSNTLFCIVDPDEGAAVDQNKQITAANVFNYITFLGLDDTAGTYAGSAGYLLRVNATPDGVEFVDGDSLYASVSHLHTGVYEPVFSKNTAFNKNFGVAAGTVAEGDHLHAGVYEPAFSKNTAFNKNFAGSGVADTVARSDHNHTGVYEPAFAKNDAFNKSFGTGINNVARGNHLHAGVYEPAFSKNTAFNKNFGTGAGEVAQGNHTHLLAAGATDVTATFTELNLLDLAGLSVGEVLAADGAATASWRQLLGSEINNDLGWITSASVGAGYWALTGTSTLTGNATIDIDSNDLVFTDAAGVGLQYNADYSATFVDRSLVDKEYVDNAVTTAVGTYWTTTGTTTLINDVFVEMDTQSELYIGTDYSAATDLVGMYFDNDKAGTGATQLTLTTAEDVDNYASVVVTTYFGGDSEIVLAVDGYGSGLELEININSTDGIVATTSDGEGIKYAADYSATYVARSLVDKAYVDAAIVGGIPSNIVYNNQANVYQDFNQDFRSSRLRIANPANTFHYNFTGSAIAANRTITLPLLTGNDAMITAAASQQLTNKTINATSNTITDTSTAAGDLLRSNGTKFVRLARGSANQVLKVNSGGTNIEWGTITSVFTFRNGITATGSIVELGGALTKNTFITSPSYYYDMTIGNSAIRTQYLQQNISIQLNAFQHYGTNNEGAYITAQANSTPFVQIYTEAATPSNRVSIIVSQGVGVVITDEKNGFGASYAADYSTNGIATYGDRWIPDKGYVDSLLGSVTAPLTLNYNPVSTGTEDILIIERNTSGTPALTTGGAIYFKAEKDGGVLGGQGRIRGEWNDKGIVSYEGKLILSTDGVSGEQDMIELVGDYSNPHIEAKQMFKFNTFAKSGLPAASLYQYMHVFITDEAGGAILCFSDGTNWRRVTDRAVVS